MSLLVVFILGMITSYLIVTHVQESKVRVEVLKSLLGFSNEEASKWLNNKNPGVGLKKPADLEFCEFYEYVKSIA